jgi:hypothetical protein
VEAIMTEKFTLTDGMFRHFLRRLSSNQTTRFAEIFTGWNGKVFAPKKNPGENSS